MADDFAPPPAIDPAPAAAVRRSEFRDAPTARPRRRLSRWAWVAIASGLVAIGAGVAAAAIVDTHATALEPAAPGTTGRLHSAQVITGMCLTALPAADGPAGTVTAVACDRPHHAEVVASYAFSSQKWPGTTATHRAVLDYCATQLGPRGPLARATTARTLVAWTPSEQTWAAGDRTGLCIVTSDRPWTGSVLDHTAAQPA